MSLRQVEAAGRKLGAVPRPTAPPTALPDPGDTSLDGVTQEKPRAEPDMQAEARRDVERTYLRLAGPKDDFAVPTLQELGFPPATKHIAGGETAALTQLDHIAADETYIATFEKPQTAPTAFAPPATTLLSPHLHFGSLGAREFWWRVQDIVAAYPPGRASAPPVSLAGQLLFRDMYFGAQAALGAPFAQTLHNPRCRFVPWHLPSRVVVGGAATRAYHVDSARAEDWFQRWKYGRTGFPWIDALMRQLRQEGWIHHLGRHAVACFLTRGGCYVSWERGADVFEEWLLDHETACNVGNWQWLSCTAFYSQFYRCYSPVAFPRKTDPEGAFVRRYCPELKALPAKYIYEPWKAPLVDQKKAGVRVTGDGTGQDADAGMYPRPMFDFDERRAVCIEGMREAYRVGLYGDDPRVVDGSWRTLFADGAEGSTEWSAFEDAMEAANDGRKIRKGPGSGDGDDGVVLEDGGGAADEGGDGRGGDCHGNRRKRGRGAENNLERFVKKNKG